LGGFNEENFQNSPINATWKPKGGKSGGVNEELSKFSPLNATRKSTNERDLLGLDGINVESVTSPPEHAPNLVLGGMRNKEIFATNKSPDQKKMGQGGSGEKFSSPGGSFSGPVLAEVEKTMKEAQAGGLVVKTDKGDSPGRLALTWKRKNRDEENEQGRIRYGLNAQKKKKGNGGEVKTAVSKKTRQLIDGSISTHGSGMAVTGEQPCRLQ
jgi:hypothetical protein